MERHTTMFELKALYPCILTALEELSGPGHNPKTVRDARSLHICMKSAKFIACLIISEYMLGFTKQLSVSLQGLFPYVVHDQFDFTYISGLMYNVYISQVYVCTYIQHTIFIIGSTKEVVSAYRDINDVIATIQTQRQDQTVFEDLWQSMLRLAEPGVMTRPRLAAQQTLRSNHPVDSDEAYYRSAYYNPYCDHLISDLTTRFEASPLLSKGREAALFPFYFFVPICITLMLRCTCTCIADRMHVHVHVIYSFCAFNRISSHTGCVERCRKRGLPQEIPGVR